MDHYRLSKTGSKSAAELLHTLTTPDGAYRTAVA